jgi:exonuclease III
MLTSVELSSASTTCRFVSNLRCYITNVRSIMNKLLNFNWFIEYNDPDIIALTETWLCDKVPNSLIACSTYYSMYRRDRLSRHGGGTCLIIKNNLKFSTQQISLPFKFDCIEILAVDLMDYSSTLPFRFVVAYRPLDYASSDNDLFFTALD